MGCYVLYRGGVSVGICVWGQQTSGGQCVRGRYACTIHVYGKYTCIDIYIRITQPSHSLVYAIHRLLYTQHTHMPCCAYTCPAHNTYTPIPWVHIGVYRGVGVWYICIYYLFYLFKLNYFIYFILFIILFIYLNIFCCHKHTYPCPYTQVGIGQGQRVGYIGYRYMVYMILILIIK